MVNILNYGAHNFPGGIYSGRVFGIRVSILKIVQSLSSLGLLASERSERAQSSSCSIEISDTYVYMYKL